VHACGCVRVRAYVSACACHPHNPAWLLRTGPTARALRPCAPPTQPRGDGDEARLLKHPSDQFMQPQGDGDVARLFGHPTQGINSCKCREAGMWRGY